MPSSARAGPWLFFVLVYGWTWLFWLLAAAMRVSAQSTTGRALVIAGLLGPMLGGVGFTYAARDPALWRDYWTRIIDVRRIPLRWAATIVLVAPVLMALAALLAVASGDDVAPALIAARTAPFAAAPLALGPFLLHVLIYGPVPEELGWRGYALDRLQVRFGTLSASLVLGALWAAWHLPLFFIRDMNPHYGEGAGSLWFWLFMAQVVAISVVYSFVFNNTRRSTLAAILLHVMTNIAAGLGNVTATTNLYATLLWVAAAAILAPRLARSAGKR